MESLTSLTAYLTLSLFICNGLQIIGNIGEAMEAADATVKTTLLKCMRQPTTTLQVQLAAIQAFRRMSVTDEVNYIQTPKLT